MKGVYKCYRQMSDLLSLNASAQVFSSAINLFMSISVCNWFVKKRAGSNAFLYT